MNRLCFLFFMFMFMLMLMFMLFEDTADSLLSSVREPASCNSSYSSSLGSFSRSSLISLTLLSSLCWMLSTCSYVSLLPLRISVRNMLRSRTSEADMELMRSERSLGSESLSWSSSWVPSAMACRMLLPTSDRCVLGARPPSILWSHSSIFFISCWQSRSLGTARKFSILIFSMSTSMSEWILDRLSSMKASQFLGKFSEFRLSTSSTKLDSSLKTSCLSNLFLSSSSSSAILSPLTGLSSLITCTGFPGILTVNPVKFILLLPAPAAPLVDPYCLMSSAPSPYFLFPNLIFFLLLSMKVFALPFCGPLLFSIPFAPFLQDAGSSTFFYGPRFSIFEFFFSNGFDVSLDSSSDVSIFQGISGILDSTNFLKRGSLFFYFTYSWKSFFFQQLALTPFEQVSENLEPLRGLELSSLSTVSLV